MITSKSVSIISVKCRKQVIKTLGRNFRGEKYFCDAF